MSFLPTLSFIHSYMSLPVQWCVTMVGLVSVELQWIAAVRGRCDVCANINGQGGWEESPVDSDVHVVSCYLLCGSPVMTDWFRRYFLSFVLSFEASSVHCNSMKALGSCLNVTESTEAKDETLATEESLILFPYFMTSPEQTCFLHWDSTMSRNMVLLKRLQHIRV